MILNYKIMKFEKKYIHIFIEFYTFIYILNFTRYERKLRKPTKSIWKVWYFFFNHNHDIRYRISISLIFRLIFLPSPLKYFSIQAVSVTPYTWAYMRPDASAAYAHKTSVRRACLPPPDWPSWPPSIFLVYVSRYVNISRIYGPRYCIAVLCAGRSWIRSARRDNVFIGPTKHICPTRASFIFKWAVDFILCHLAHLFRDFSYVHPVSCPRYISNTKSDYRSSEF